MKATIKETTQEFKPITIEIIIENKSELEELYTRLIATDYSLHCLGYEKLKMLERNEPSKLLGKIIRKEI